jgi:activator of HSP90 ATPase
MSVHCEATIPAEPARVYEVLADAAALSARSGKGGAAARTPGGEFTAFDGYVTGRQVELVPGERIVQAWRFPAWDPGVYSIVRFTLAAADGGTMLGIDQHGEPADWHDHVDANWPTFYTGTDGLLTPHPWGCRVTRTHLRAARSQAVSSHARLRT